MANRKDKKQLKKGQKATKGRTKSNLVKDLVHTLSFTNYQFQYKIYEGG